MRLRLKLLRRSAVCMAVGALQAQSPYMPDWQTAAGGKMAFEVASIKPDSGPFRPPRFPLDNGNAYIPGLQFSADFGLLTYIEFAYKICFTPQQRQSMRSRMPEWILAGPYDGSSRAIRHRSESQYDSHEGPDSVDGAIAACGPLP